MIAGCRRHRRRDHAVTRIHDTPLRDLCWLSSTETLVTWTCGKPKLSWQSYNLRNLLLTNRGERLGLFNFGSNLSELVFEYQNRDDFTQEVSKRITESVETYIPSIEINDISIQEIDKNKKFNLNEKGLAAVSLKVDFSIPIARITNLSIAVELNPGG